MKNIFFLSSLLFFQNCIADITLAPEPWSLTPDKKDIVVTSDIPSKKMTVEISVDPSSTEDLAVYQCEDSSKQGSTTSKPHLIKHDDNRPYACFASYHSIELTSQEDLSSKDFKITGTIIRHYE